MCSQHRDGWPYLGQTVRTSFLLWHKTNTYHHVFVVFFILLFCVIWWRNLLPTVLVWWAIDVRGLSTSLLAKGFATPCAWLQWLFSRSVVYKDPYQPSVGGGARLPAPPSREKKGGLRDAGQRKGASIACRLQIHECRETLWVAATY